MGQNMPIQYSFQRYEVKYLLTEEAFQKFYKRLLERMKEDGYGVHTVCNIYFDTDTYELARHSISKPAYKEKFRVRSYGVPTGESIVYAEIKKKFDGVVYKRRIASNLEHIHQFMDECRPLAGEEQIQREIHWFLEKYRPVPKVFIGYERAGLTGREDAQLRITFDWNIRCRRENLRLTCGTQGMPVTPENKIVMEIKAPQALPLWLTTLLSEFRLYPASFSKYGTYYIKHVLTAADYEKAKENKVC